MNYFFFYIPISNVLRHCRNVRENERKHGCAQGYTREVHIWRGEFIICYNCLKCIALLLKQWLNIHISDAINRYAKCDFVEYSNKKILEIDLLCKCDEEEVSIFFLSSYIFLVFFIHINIMILYCREVTHKMESVESKYMQLQNQSSEVGHLQKEIERCLQYPWVEITVEGEYRLIVDRMTSRFLSFLLMNSMRRPNQRYYHWDKSNCYLITCSCLSQK